MLNQHRRTVLAALSFLAGCGLVEPTTSTTTLPDDPGPGIAAPRFGDPLIRPRLAYQEVANFEEGPRHWRPSGLWATNLETEVLVADFPRAISYEAKIAARQEEGAPLQIVPFGGGYAIDVDVPFPTPQADAREVEISPDGRWIAWTTWAGDLRLARTDGTEAKVVRDVEGSRPGDIQWSASSTFFSLHDDANGYVVSAETADWWALGADIERNRWSPDGEMVAWSVVHAGGARDVFVADAENLEGRQLLEKSKSQWTWAESASVLLIFDFESNWFRVDLDSGELERLPSTDQLTNSGPIRWLPSPDGRHLAQLCTLRSHQSLCIDGAAVSPPGSIVSGFAFGRFPLAWTSDSTRIAFVADGRLYVADAGGSRVGPAGESVQRLVWASKGDRIAFGDARGVFVVPADTLEPPTFLGSQIVREGQISWGPRDEALYFIGTQDNLATQHVYRARLDGSNTVQVSDKNAYRFVVVEEP